MALVAYFDESGDHSLGKIDPSAPTFCLALTLFDSETYVNTVVPAVTRFKFAHFGHEAVVLHSADIRKSRNAFAFLNNATLREPFMTELSELMAMPDYEIIAIVIRKDRLVARYKEAESPYDLSMMFALERLLDWAKQRHENEVRVVAESRGRKEDTDLEASFYRVVANGTAFVPAAEFAAVRMRLTFATKVNNLVGHQLADLAAYPFARKYAKPLEPYPPFNVVHRRLYPGVRGQVYGLKVFP